MRARRRTGFTVVEVALGTALVGIVLGTALLAQRSTQGLFTSTATAGLLQEKGLRAVEAVALDLRWADPETFLVTQENGSDRLDLRTPTGFVDDETSWSAPVVYRVVPSAIDSDEDGELGEWRLVREQDGVVRPLCDHIVPGGFTVTVAEDNAQVRLSLRKRDRSSGALLESDAQTSITLRN